MNRIRAKFQVDEITRTASSKYNNETRKSDPCELHTLKMSPVRPGDEDSENKAFWDATPSGKLELMMVNPETVAGINPGDEFYVELTPCDSVATD